MFRLINNGPIRLIVGLGNKGERYERESKDQLLAAAAREDRRIELRNMEREAKNHQGFVACCLADVIATRARISELRKALDEAEKALLRRERRHADAQRKLEQLQREVKRNA
jgi:hypothetical protein